MNSDVWAKDTVFTYMNLTTNCNKRIGSYAYAIFNGKFFAEFTNDACALNDTIPAERNIVAKFYASAGERINVCVIADCNATSAGDFLFAFDLYAFSYKYALTFVPTLEVKFYKKTSYKLRCFYKAKAKQVGAGNILIYLVRLALDF